jgi:Zn-dependent peptidase ImmA (M78 family)
MIRAGYEQAEATGLSKAQVFAIAESVAKQLGFGPGDDIHALVERLGGRVVVQDTLTEDPARSGSLFVDSPTKFTIIVPTHTGQLRDRFTVAHELGHFLLHYMWRRHHGAQIGPMMALRKGSDRIEWEANWFAGAFLMPSAEFAAEFRNTGGRFGAVASKFDVSVSAAEVRARQLGLA